MSRRNTTLTRGCGWRGELGWPYLELLGRAHGARIINGQSVELGAKRCLEVIEMATRHGWGEQPMVGVAYTQLGGAELNQGHLEEAGRWLDRAQQIFRTELEPSRRHELPLDPRRIRAGERSPALGAG